METESDNVAITRTDADSAKNDNDDRPRRSNSVTCVICLEANHDPLLALPCKHNQFHFSCLGTWLFVKSTCPLCKVEVTAVCYTENIQGKLCSKSVSVPLEIGARPPPDHQISRSQLVEHRRRRYRQHGRYRRYSNEADSAESAALRFRKYVYQHGLYSMHVGTNRHSSYRTITPAKIRASPTLIRKARIFIRRELKVFEFLNSSSVQDQRRTDRRSTNAEFLLEYVIEVIKVIDVKGSAGQAEELISEFLGQENARLFLHELGSWLRSPFDRLRGWDEAVQYP